MGKEKYLRQVERLFSESAVVKSSSIARIVQNKKGGKGYVKQLLRHLKAKGRVKRLGKGYYTAHDEVSYAVFCFQPAYLALQDALSFHNLWEQETIPVIITIRKVRQGIRRILGTNVLIRRINKKYFFGFEYYRQGNVAIPYSDVEKTFLDMLYFNEKISDALIRSFREKIRRKRLESYINRYPKKIQTKAASLIKFR